MPGTTRKERLMSYKKLVRDRIPEIIAAHGDRPVTRVLDDAEYKHELRYKLLEEVREVMVAPDAATVLAEIADLIEVAEAAAKAYGYSSEDLRRVQAEKRAQRGGFDQRIFLIGVEARP